MASRKRNEFLDIEESDEDQSDYGYDSEAAEESKTRASKRRKVLDTDNKLLDLEDDDNDDDEYNDVEVGAAEDNDDNDELEDGESVHDGAIDNKSSQSVSKPREKPLKPLNKPPKKNKTGVVYLSSLPPYLKPSTLRSLLEQRGFGPILRIFLSPSVRSNSGSVKRSNRRKTYSDGWVEFQSKKKAKICAETLNSNIIGQRGWYHDDIWNMKYLKGYKWADLMESTQRERSEREARQRIEDTRARKEDKVFISGVEKGKVVEGIRKKREDKKKAKAVEASDAVEEAASDLQIRRVFRQNEVKQKRDGQDSGPIGDDARRVLGKIF